MKKEKVEKVKKVKPKRKKNIDIFSFFLSTFN